jgi:hypothetical protein
MHQTKEEGRRSNPPAFLFALKRLVSPREGMQHGQLVGLFGAFVITASPALAIEPQGHQFSQADQGATGAVRLSVQSQVQQQGTIHVWFLREAAIPPARRTC